MIAIGVTIIVASIVFVCCRLQSIRAKAAQKNQVLELRNTNLIAAFGSWMFEETKKNVAEYYGNQTLRMLLFMVWESLGFCLFEELKAQI
jgi:hypothetical protein